MNKKLPTLLTVAAVGILTATAVPAKRDAMVVTQPDGTTLTIHKVGDEHAHFILTDDDKLVVEDENGQYSYANIDANGIITSTKIKALDSAVRPKSHQYIVQSISDANVKKFIKSKPLKMANYDVTNIGVRKSAAKATSSTLPQAGMGKFTSDFPTKGKVKGLIILVEYSDMKFKTSYTTSAKDYFTNMINQTGFNENGGTGCAREYFEEMSFNQFTPEFDVVGPYTLSNGYAYYGKNDSSGDDVNATGMIAEACYLADDDVDFSQYDNDGDGVCDNVFVFYAGKGEATYGTANTVWPHSWNLSYDKTLATPVLDGVKIDRYACTNEWLSTRPDGVGTFIHEFSHVMGLPDLYDTSSKLYCTPCDYDCLDYGPYNNDGCTPPAYSVFERNAMGWIDLKLLDKSESVTLGHIEDTNEGCIIQTSKDNEFFLFENRQQSGWDTYIPGHGMLIWHIDFDQTIFDANTVNNSSSHQYVDIVEANNKTNTTSMSATTEAGWTWPGTAKKTSYTSTTNPAFKQWNKTEINMPITNIKEEDGIITFDVLGGDKLQTPVPTEAENIETGKDYFVASWSKVEDATDYKLWVYAVNNQAKVAPEEASSYDTETADMGTDVTKVTLPDGWSTNANLTPNTAANNYGENAPAAKMASSNTYIMTREYTNEVVAISLWARTTGTRTLTVDGKINDRWVEIGTVTPKSEGQTYELNDIPGYVTQVKFTLSGGNVGNISIDDIKITVSGGLGDELLADYDGILTNGKTEYKVDKLVDGITTYRFKVAATLDGSLFSNPSDYVTVTLNQSGVRNISVSEPTEKVNVIVNDRTITVNTSADRVEIYNTLGRHIGSQRVSDGSAVISLPTSGMYIVRANNSSAKVVVR
jgi:M6 family metalloprotease-like protein